MPPIRRLKNVDWQDLVDENNDLFEIPELRVAVTNNRGKYLFGFTVYARPTIHQWYMQFFEGDSGAESFIPDKEGGKRIQFFRPDQITSRKLKQIFKLNDDSNCVFVALRQRFNALLSNAKTKTLINGYKRLLRMVDDEEERYPNGVPEDSMQELADELAICIIIKDAIGQEQNRYTSAKPNCTVELTNTRAHHLELVNHDQIIEVDDVVETLHRLKENNEYYVIINDTKNPRRIKTKEGILTKISPDDDEVQLFMAQFNYAQVDAKKYPELNLFTANSRHIHSSPLVFQDFTPNTKLYDMKQAYLQYKETKYYEGFLTVIQQFRKIDHIISTGIYKFKVIEDIPFSRKFGIRKDDEYVMVSPVIKFWTDNGVKIEITEGCFGHAEDITFPENLTDDRKLYQKAIGRFSMADNFRETKYTFQCTETFAEHIATQHTADYWNDSKEISIRIPNQSVLTNHHIAAFIVGYTQINMLEAIKSVPFDSIKAVLLDGIYADQPITNPMFRVKPIFPVPCLNAKWYEPDRNCYNFPPFIKQITTNTFLSGAGGSGKTHTILTDKGYVNPLYVVPTRELGRKKQEELGTHWETIHRTLGKLCDAIKYIPAVILADEITMVQKEWIEELLQKFPKTLILLAGDIDATQHYQCRGGTSNNYMEIYKPTIPIVEFTHDYRSLTPEMKNFKINLRKEMKRIYEDGGLNDTKKLREYLLAHNSPIRILSLAQAHKEAQETDIFLYSTNAVRDRITHPNKKGVHAFQGQTVEPPTRLFITVDWFEYAMPYTAISRARHHNQIIFVKSK